MAFQPTTLGYYWFLQLVLATEMFHWKHLRYYSHETIKYLDETLCKEGVQDLVLSGSILVHCTKWVLTATTEIQSSALIRKYLRRKNTVIAPITRGRL